MSEGTYVYFGNVSLSQWETMMGIALTAEDSEWLSNHRQESAQDIAGDKFHIFSLPAQILVGGEIVDELVSRLSKYDYGKAQEAYEVVGLK